MKTLEEKIAVMTAALEGKEIQWYDGILWVGCDGDVEYDWQHYDYRIKPEEPKPKYVPYESAEEFLQAQKEHGLYVRDKNYNAFSIPNYVITYCLIDGVEQSYKELLCNYVWQDGTPCGKLKQ